MKKLNLIKRLWTDSHEKQSPQRFARYAAILIMLLTLGVGQMWGNGNIGYKGVKFTKNGAATGWYNIHNVSWGYSDASYECRSGQSGVTDFNNSNLGTVTTLKLKAFVVIGWTDNEDYVAGQLKYRLYKQSASAPSYSTYNVGNYGTSSNTAKAANVLASSGNDRVVGSASLTTDIVTASTAPGNYYLQLQGLGRMQWSNGSSHGDFNANNGSEVKATLLVPGFTTTSTSNAYGSVNVGSNSSATISFTQHYGTTLTTGDCSLTNSTDFAVTGISETGVTVKFMPQSTGDKSSTLTITDANSKTCTITLTGTGTSASTATLTYHANWYTTGTSGDVPDAQTVAVDATATVADRNTLAMTNYTFSGWNTEEYITGTSYAVGSSITMDEDKDLYAVWTRSFTLNQNGATTNGTTSVTGTYNCSTLPSITNPQKTGYTFVGWRTENNGTGNLVINTSGALQSGVYHWTDEVTPSNRFQRYPTSTSPLYATWSQDVTLNANTSNHGSGSNKTGTVIWNGTSITISTHCSAATGYSLDGYYTAATGGTKILNADKSFAGSNITVSGDPYISSGKWVHPGATTLYAQYTPNVRTITFAPNGGTVTPTSASVTYDAAISNAPIPTKTGYNFTGYNTAGGASITTNAGVFKASVDGFTDASAHWVKDADATITAQWTAKTTTVTLDQQSGSGGSGSVTATYGSAMPAATMPTYTGYDFGGYYTGTSGSGTKYYNTNGSSAKNWNFEDATKTLYAKWTAHAYNITYNLDGGTNDLGNPDTYTIESSLITLEEPTKTGYDFDGWYTNSGKTISGNTIAAGSTGDKTFWAKWTVKNYNITYSPGSAPEGVTYTTTPSNADYGATVNMVFTPTGDNTVIVTVEDESSNEVTVTNPSPNTYRFTMPASDVTVSVSVLSLPIVYVLKSKYSTAYFPDGFTSGGSADQVKIWAWETSTGGNNNFFTGGDWPGYTAQSKATEYTDAHGNVWWRFIPTNTSYFTRSTPYSLIINYDNGSTTSIYESNANDHYVSDGTKRETCNSSTKSTFTGTVWVVPGGTGSHSATLYYENPSSSKKFCFVQGRFKAYTDKSRQTVLYTDPNDGTKWGTNSTNIRMFYDETNSRYYLHTYCTPNELRSISSNNGYIHLTTSTVTSSLTGGSAYYANSSVNLTAADTKINFSTTSGSNRPYITSTVTNKYVVLYWDESKLWYEEEPIPAAIDNIGLSVSRVPPMASITATPNMSVKGTVNQAYCWGVYTDAGCTEGNKVDVSFSSVGDGKVQFVAPQEQRTYYLKLTVRSTDACDAAIDDEEVVSFTVTTSQMVFFKKVPNWGNVHFYFLGASYWDNDKGAGCKDRDGGAAHGMTRIGNSDVYYYDYSGNSVMTTYMASNSTAYIAFTDNYKPNSNNFSGCQAAYRGDFSACAPMYVPENYITDYKNTSAGDGQAAYYNRGYWTTYMSENSGFTLHVYDSKTKNSGTQIFYHDMEGTVGNNTYTFTYDFADASQLPPYTYGFEVSGCGGSWYAVDADMDITNSTNWNIYTGTSRRGGIDIVGKLEHTFILTLTGDGHVQLSVEYPLAEGDYRLLYDDETQSPHPSQYVRARANGKDTVSMFIRPSSDEALLKVQICTDLDPITWEDYAWNSGSAAISIAGTEDGVYNFYLEQDGSSNLTVNTSETKPYSGKYYIRTSGVDGGWTSYKTSLDNLMTYAQYPDDKGYGFNYYKAKWVGSTGTNVTYTIACDYSPSLSDTLVADPGNNPLDTAQSRSLPHSANIRFGWHSKTNHLKREYINGSSNISDRYLVMIGDAKLMNPDGTPLAISGLNANEISFADLNNWIYRCDVKAQEGAAVKLQATYDDHPQYFIGGADKTEEIIGGSGENAYVMRVTYDFKTNRLMTAWLPSGTQVTDSIVLDADMMLIREGQNAATQVFFNGSGKAISDIHTIYGVMEFQYSNIVGKFPNWSSPNAYKYLMYYISFPFDVKVSEIFGCGVRGENWIIQKYNGAKRAKIGWFAETSTFWETMEGNETMNAYEGYLLILDRISFNDPSSSLWFKQGEGNSIYLYFPSTSVASGTISEAATTIHIPEHTCTIDRTFDVGGVGTVSHKNTDSHWNVIGTPLFEDKEATTIATPSADGAGATTLQYYYAWNSADNTLAAQAAFDDDVEFKSMHGYMVQYAGDVTFSGAKLTPPPASVAARRIPGDKKNYRIKLRMMNEDGNRSETFVELRENACDTFALNEDMYMMRSSTTVDLYTFAGAYDVAANVLSMNNHIVPVGMDVKRAGMYRFTMPSDFSGTVTLIDTEADVRTNLALGDYEVKLPKGTSNNRFFLEINIHQMPTAIDGVGGSLKDGKAHKFIENGQMYILQNGIIYDARGNRVR